LIQIDFFDTITQDKQYNLECKVQGTLDIPFPDNLSNDLKNQLSLNCNEIFSALLRKAVLSTIKNFIIVNHIGKMIDEEIAPELGHAVLTTIFNSHDYNTICAVCNEFNND